MELDPLILSRLQFAWVIAWHILLPAFTVGLASFIAFLEGAYAFTKKPVFINLSNFWLRIFAISFGMGVVTGHRDAVSVRHQLEPVFGRRREHLFAAARL